MNPESSSEQAIKALQAQSAQFQEMVLSLAQGQQELKTLLLKKKKKKRTKKITEILNMGRRFQGQTRRALDFATTSDEKDNQDGKGKETIVQSDSEEEEEEEDYSEE